MTGAGGVFETMVIVGPLVDSSTSPGTGVYWAVSLWRRSKQPLANAPATQMKIQTSMAQSKRGVLSEVNVIKTAFPPSDHSASVPTDTVPAASAGRARGTERTRGRNHRAC